MIVITEGDLREFIKEQLRPIVGKGYSEHEWEPTINEHTEKIMGAVEEYVGERLRDEALERAERWDSSE